MRLWETYFRLWQKFSLSLTEKTKQLQSKDKDLEDDYCIVNYYGSVSDKCFVTGI